MNNQIENMSRQELLDQIRAERGYLENILTYLSNAQMLLPGVDGEWSVKDALAHISAWERRMIKWVRSLQNDEVPDIPLPWDVDRMNADTFSQVKDRSLTEVLEEFHHSYSESMELAESLSEEQLQTIYSDTWPIGPLWTGIAANTSWHYKDHRSDIQKWLETHPRA
jgi:hypothetical protein